MIDFQDIDSELDRAMSAMQNVGVLSAMNDALNDPADIYKAFRATFVIAKSFFYLGDNLSEVEMVVKASRKFLENPEDRNGAKMAFIGRNGRQTIIAMTKVGAIVIDNEMYVTLRGEYSKMSDRLFDKLGSILELLILKGAPFIGLCDILTAYHNDEAKLEEKFDWLHGLLVDSL